MYRRRVRLMNFPARLLLLSAALLGTLMGIGAFTFVSRASGLGPSRGRRAGEVRLCRDVCAATSARTVFGTEITGRRCSIQAIWITDSTPALAPVASLISCRGACPPVAHTLGIIRSAQHIANARKVRTGAIVSATIAQSWIGPATVGIGHAAATIAAIITVVVTG